MPTKQLENEKTRFDTRLPKEQKRFFERAAVIGGYRNLTDFIISTVKEKANQIIKEKETIIASEKDKKIFFDAISNPTAPNKSLASAAKEYKKIISK
jgi:uncharacterized protein (DUF1778 family)